LPAEEVPDSKVVYTNLCTEDAGEEEVDEDERRAPSESYGHATHRTKTAKWQQSHPEPTDAE
jgi:hypothetical protein